MHVAHVMSREHLRESRVTTVRPQSRTVTQLSSAAAAADNNIVIAPLCSNFMYTEFVEPIKSFNRRRTDEHLLHYGLELNESMSR